MNDMTGTAPAPLVVGTTGHRPNRLRITSQQLRRRLAHVLFALKQGAASAGSRPLAMSALAEGADRTFAEVALALNYDLTVVLPFPSAAYMTTFGKDADLTGYIDLLKRASTVRELPGTLGDRDAAYEAMGRTMVDASSVFVGVWDGQPSAGRGGTPEIMEYALHRQTPVVWIDASRDRQPRLLKQPAASGPRAVPLAKLASRAEVVTPKIFTRLSAARTVPSHGRSE
jgi:hypothetical protein